ncbi:MAG: excinuclease ABC subunit UvrC, partial [Bacillota bacterium]|nr:excinuclease ABC subunit UvrC [Bacillota bacterium]
MFDLEYQLKILPDKSGVYLMKNSLGEIIYVGKAKILKNRVRSYFQNSKNHAAKVKAMVSNIYEFEYIVTDSEMEALILECNLIKKFRPRYNILLKDDKQYPFIKITVNEDFPRVIKTRKVVKDGSKYFGPYTDVTALNETLEIIKNNFLVRCCSRVIKDGTYEKRPCINYSIGLCSAPCVGKISKEEYKNIIDDIIRLLNGDNTNIVNSLKNQMEKLSDELDFEKAAKIRDRIKAIDKVSSKQNIIKTNFKDEDFIAVFSDEKDSSVYVLMYREGKIVGKDNFIIENTEGMEVQEIIEDFILQYYKTADFIPSSIYVEDIGAAELLEQYLSTIKEGKVSIKLPVKGDKKTIINMTKANAKLTISQFKLKLLKDKEEDIKSLIELKELLNLPELPKRIESYDISNIFGMDSVGSMVVFQNGKPSSRDYRRFKIRDVIGPNDYKSMEEIIERRFKRGLEETKLISENMKSYTEGKFSLFPDLIIMDGGKGQVSSAEKILRKLSVNIPVCGLIKDDKHNTRGLIYNNNEISLYKGSKLFKLLERIQDEVHRFAISYHRSLRDKKMVSSVLDNIPRIGLKRRKELLKKFKSIDNIKLAKYEELIDTPSIDKLAAEEILKYFRDEGDKDEI